MTGVFFRFFVLFCFFISSDQEFVLHLDTSEGEEDESGWLVLQVSLF